MARKQDFLIHRFGKGVTLLGEPIAGVASAAISIFVSSGAVHDPKGLEGSSSILAELMTRGAGQFDARSLSAEFEKLGILRNHTVGGEATVFSFSMLAENLERALELASLVLVQPQLPIGELENVKELSIQDLDALEDEPASKVMYELSRRFYPEPFGRSQLGTHEGVKAISHETLSTFYRETFREQPLIIGIAGSFDWSRVVEVCEREFAKWDGGAPAIGVPAPRTVGSYYHLDKESAQVQIALAYPSVSLSDPDYYAARVAIGVLSGGMAGRLFVEVREKLGLVYRVGASLSAARGRGAVFASAGTTPENAQQTLDVMLRELRGVVNGVTDDELKRSIVELKASLIMQSEFSSVRAGALVSDWWNIGRLRPLAEIRAAIEGVTSAAIVSHLQRYPASPISIVTLGSKKVEVSL